MAKSAKKPNIINSNSLKFIEKYLNNSSPTGYEAEGQKIWLEYIKPYIDEHITDNYGTAVGIINPKSDFKVVIEAHADEITWTVNYITETGFIYVQRNGGTDHQIAPSKRVKIHTEKGLVDAVFGWPAIHTRTGKPKEEVPEVKNIFLDCGCTNREEVEKLGIHVGCIVSYEDPFMIMNKDYYVGRGIDNRMGGVVIAEVARLLHENKDKLPFGLYITNAVQEEVGLRGAQMITETIKPNIAIITDVCHDTQTPMIEKQVEGDYFLGKGPVVTYAPAVQTNLLKLIIKTAEKNKIPFQRMARSRFTGTDTDAFAYSNGGVPSALISLPIRYMHTTVETAHREDIENLIRLIYNTLKNIKKDHNFSYFS